MVTHDGTRRPDRPWIPSAQPWAPESVPAIGCPPTAVAPPMRAVSGGWDVATVLVLLGMFLSGIAVVAVVRGIGPVLGAATQRVKICNRFDASADTTRCTGSDPFLIVHHGATSAYLQIDVSGEASRSDMPVTIRVTKENGAGLVIAAGSIRRVIHPDRAGVAVLPLQAVFAACRIPLPAATAGNPHWERASYEVQVLKTGTSLGETVFHPAL